MGSSKSSVTFLSYLLEQAGYCTYKATEVDEVNLIIEQNHIDIALVDQQGEALINGRSCQQTSQNPAYAAIPLILITDAKTGNQIVTNKATQPSENRQITILTKPILPIDLMHAIRDIETKLDNL